MHTALRLSCTIALALLAATVCEAQTETLRSGDRVRITIPAFTASGALAGDAVDPDTLRLTLKGRPDPLLVPWSSVTRLSVSQPRTRRQGALNGTKWGFVWGVALGAIAAGAPAEEGDEEHDPRALFFEAAFSGAMIGATVGALRPGRRWQRLNVAETRESVRLALTQHRPAEQPSTPVREATPSTRAGETPAVEFGIALSGPRFRYAQFPGLLAALAINAGWKPTQGVSLVADAHGALFATAIMAGPRVYVRTAPLFSRRTVVTSFAQVLAGSLRAERSGVVESTGGRALQPGVGIELGSRSVAARVQVDYTIVRNGFIFDDRVPGTHVYELTGARGLIGVTLRSRGWRDRD